MTTTEPLKQSIHDLRVMAQALGVSNIFEMDAVHLRQAIELKRVSNTPPPMPLPQQPAYDSRLMTKRPSFKSSPLELTKLLEEHIKMGLKLTLDEEVWHMAHGKKTDTGTMRMPLRNIIKCAEGVLR